MKYRTTESGKFTLGINCPEIPDSWAITILASMPRAEFKPELFKNGNVNDRQLSNLTDQGVEFVEMMWKRTLSQIITMNIERTLNKFLAKLPEYNKKMVEMAAKHNAELHPQKPTDLN